MPELVVLAEQLLAPVPGGTGRYTAELLAALAATTPEGWSLTAVTARHRGLAPAAVDGVPGPRALALPRKGLTAAWERGVPLWPGGDAVHAPTPLAPPRTRRGRSLVITVHDTVPFTHPETLTPRGAAWHRKVIQRATQRASAVVVPTYAVAEELRQLAPGPAPLHVIGHGVPDSLLAEPSPADTDRVVRALRLPPGYVLAVGTVEPRKGLDVLIAAMARRQAPELPVVIAGPAGWGGVDLVAEAARVGLDPSRLYLLGRISDAELGVVLRGASVLAMPSRAEGFGLPLLEAMALGVPVVHSDVPALVEVAGGTGVSVPSGDAGALARALRDVAGSRPIADARRRARGFTWQAAAHAVWKLHLRLRA